MAEWLNGYIVKQLILYPFLLAAVVSALATPLVIQLANRFGLVDDPKKRKHPAHIHTGVIPRAGGLAIYLGVMVTASLLLPVDQHLRGIMAGATLIIVMGLLDDKDDLNPYCRLLTCFLAAGLVVASGIGIAFINNPLGGIIHLDQPRIYFELLGETRSIWVLSDLFALFWIVWCMNMVNWSKGVEGQMPGFVVIAAITIGLLSLRFSADITQWPVTILAFVTAGAFLGFLPFNFYPQKIMPGFGGGTLAGFLLAVLAILSTAKVGTMILVLGVPLIDGGYTFFRRIFRGHSPVWGDQGHFHHRLLSLGWGKRRVAIFYWLITAFLGVLALNLNSQQKFYTIIFLVILLGGAILWLKYLSVFSEE